MLRMDGMSAPQTTPRMPSMTSRADIRTAPPRLVRMERVSKTYPHGGAPVAALVDVSLAVGAGEFVAVTGPSGAGKSTLLHVLGGLDRPDGGEVHVGDQRLSLLSDDELTLWRRRAVGFVFQSFNLLPTLNVVDNVALPLMIAGWRARDVVPRVLELLERVGLSNRRTHRPDQLSGGEMQRVAIARALVTDPVLLLADEPTGNLDSRTGGMILELLAATRTREQTIVMVTHDPVAASYAGRTIEVRDGAVASDTSRRDVSERPAT